MSVYAYYNLNTSGVAYILSAIPAIGVSNKYLVVSSNDGCWQIL